VEAWDGRQWSRLPAPSPGVLGNSLRGVTAVSATDVWAVGWYLAIRATSRWPCTGTGTRGREAR
jgi:hypothetical protein